MWVAGEARLDLAEPGLVVHPRLMAGAVSSFGEVFGAMSSSVRGTVAIGMRSNSLVSSMGSTRTRWTTMPGRARRRAWGR